MFNERHGTGSVPEKDDGQPPSDSPKGEKKKISIFNFQCSMVNV